MKIKLSVHPKDKKKQLEMEISLSHVQMMSEKRQKLHCGYMTDYCFLIIFFHKVKKFFVENIGIRILMAMI